jgi:formate-dependent nitrite reductase membrane component NrfD
VARLYREFRLEVAAMIFIAGLVTTILVIISFTLPSTRPEQPDFFYKLIKDNIGNWMVWMMLLGPILLLAGIFYLGDTIKKFREFNKLIDADSKAKFVQNQDRIEYLAWLLSARLEKQVEAKKKEFKLD